MHTLCDLHYGLNNFVEAAKTLLLHAELLPWEAGGAEEDVEEELALGTGCGRRAFPYPPETKAERRETLYREAVALLTRAQDWEGSLLLSDELRVRHATVTYDYAAMAELLREQAGYYERIAEDERFFPAHFRVGFYGRGFPEEYRNVDYVYRGDALESIIDFSARVKAKFEGATPLAAKIIPGPEHFDDPGRFLQISMLTLSNRDESAGGHKVLPRHMPPRVVKYGENNGIDTFFFRRVFRKVRAPLDLPPFLPSSLRPRCGVTEAHATLVFFYCPPPLPIHTPFPLLSSASVHPERGQERERIYGSVGLKVLPPYGADVPHNTPATEGREAGCADTQPAGDGRDGHGGQEQGAQGEDRGYGGGARRAGGSEHVHGHQWHGGCGREWRD